jgi:hypothetical protein
MAVWPGNGGCRIGGELPNLSDRAPRFAQASYFDGEYQASAAVTSPIIFSNYVVSDCYWTSTTRAADNT